MVFSESLALRVRHGMTRQRSVVEKKMFGGVGFLLHDHLVVGIWKDSLIVRVGPAVADASLSEPHVRPFDVTGRPMRGWLMIEPAGMELDASLTEWLERAIDFVRTLPLKDKPAPRKRRKERGR